MPGNEGEEPQEIVVTARLQVKRPDDSPAGFSLANWFYGRQYGQGTSQPDPFAINVDQTLSASEIVARTCESLALAIETLTDLARPVLPRAEARRLDALSKALKGAALALQAGQIDLATARTLVQSGLAVAFDTLSAAGLGVLFGAFGAWASTLAPTPLTKALAIAGLGIFGVAAEWYFSSTNISNAIATQLTDALLNGAQALSSAINNAIQTIYDAMDYLPGSQQDSSLYLQGTSTSDSGLDIVTVSLFHDSIERQLTADASNQAYMPSDWSAPGYDPKSPWNDEPPIT